MDLEQQFAYQIIRQAKAPKVEPAKFKDTKKELLEKVKNSRSKKSWYA